MLLDLAYEAVVFQTAIVTDTIVRYVGLACFEDIFLAQNKQGEHFCRLPPIRSWIR